MQKKSIGFGFRGWMLILYQAIAYITFQVFTQYPLNILADAYGGANKVSAIYSACAVAGIVIQILLVSLIAKMKSIKAFGSILGAISLVLAFLVMVLPAGTGWTVAYAIINVIAVLYSTLALGLLVGQWFPTRKGTVMGIATLAFPIANGMLGPFAESVMPTVGAWLGSGGHTASPYGLGGAIFMGFLPFFIISIVGWVIGLIFIKDYPEQVGAYRDNDKSITPEIANAIMMAEIENKKTSVWTYINTIKCKEFWFGTIVTGLLLSCAIGLMSQTQAIIGAFPELNYTTIMMLVMICGCVGSYIIGLLDTKLGTKKAMLISSVLMVIAGVLGVINTAATLVPCMIFVAFFMGASSNFGVSLAAQYWRREDFGRVFALSSPIGSAISSASPVVIAGLLFGAEGYKGQTGAFTLILVCGIISVILMAIYSPKAIKARDDKYRAKAGKELDDALVGRK